MLSESVAMFERWSRVIVIGYNTDNLGAKNYSAIHHQQKLFVFELLFSHFVSARLLMAVTLW